METLTEDEYALTKGKLFTVIGIIMFLFGLWALILENFPFWYSVPPCVAEGLCPGPDLIQGFIFNFYYYLPRNIFLLSVSVVGISFIFVGRYLSRK
jgi:hypothetical protein